MHNFEDAFKRSGLKIGDEIKLVHKFETRQFDCGLNWLNGMEPFFNNGKIYTITRVDRGFIEMGDCPYILPWFCAEKVDE